MFPFYSLKFWQQCIFYRDEGEYPVNCRLLEPCKDHKVISIPPASWREASVFKVMQICWVRARANKGWSPSLFRAHKLSMPGRGLVFVIPEAPEDTIALVGQLLPCSPLEGAGEKALGKDYTCSSSEQMCFGRLKVGAMPSFPPVHEKIN